MLNKQLRILIAITGLMVVVHIINILSAGWLVNYGVIPRDFNRLWGIFSTPWIHSDIWHLLGNLSCLVVLGWLCMLRSTRYFIIASGFIIVVGGLLLWLIGRSASHVGASGWVFGLWGLLLANAYFDRTLKNIFICVLVIFLYSGLVFGLLPSGYVSFEGHITGLASGIIFAWLTTQSESLRAWLAPRANS